MTNTILKAHLEGVDILDKIHFISEPNSVICPRCKTIYPASPVKGSFKLNTHCQKCVDNKHYTYKHNQTGEVFMEYNQEYHTSELLLPEQYYKLQFKSFLTTYGTNLLKAAKEAGPGERQPNDLEFIKQCTFYTDHNPSWDGNYYTCSICGQEFVKATEINKYRTSFHSAIDEGIKGIKKGDK